MPKQEKISKKERRQNKRLIIVWRGALLKARIPLSAPKRKGKPCAFLSFGLEGRSKARIFRYPIIKHLTFHLFVMYNIIIKNIGKKKK